MDDLAADINSLTPAQTRVVKSLIASLRIPVKTWVNPTSDPRTKRLRLRWA